MDVASIIFLVCVVFVFYAMAGYPVLLALMARVKNRELRRQFNPHSVTILMAVRNGAQWIGAKLDSILSLDYPKELMDVIVISDASDDGTDEIVKGYAAKGNVRLLRMPQGGKPVALNAGMEHARGEVLFFTDVRQQLAPDCLRNLVACFADPKVGAVSGELIILDGDSRESADIGLYWKFEKWVRRQLNRVDSIDAVTGCVWALRRELAAPLPEGTLIDDMYLPMRAVMKGYRVVFEERALAYDYPTMLDVEFRRKTRTLAGLFQVLRTYPQLLGPGNRIWFHFVSHKVARLVMPYALIGAAVSSLFMPAPWGVLAIVAQVIGYGLAAVDTWVPQTNPLKRLTSPARTFLMFMAASLWAGAVLFVPPQELWKETKVVAPKSS